MAAAAAAAATDARAIIASVKSTAAQTVAENVYWKALNYTAEIDLYAPATLIGMPDIFANMIPKTVPWNGIAKVNPIVPLGNDGTQGSNYLRGAYSGMLDGENFDPVNSMGQSNSVIMNPSRGINNSTSQCSTCAFFPVVYHVGTKRISTNPLTAATQIPGTLLKTAVIPFGVVVSNYDMTGQLTAGSHMPTYYTLNTNHLGGENKRQINLDVTYVVDNPDTVLAVISSVLAFGPKRYPDGAVWITIAPYISDDATLKWTRTVSEIYNREMSPRDAFAFTGASCGLAIAAAMMGLPSIMYTGFLNSMGPNGILTEDGLQRVAIGSNVIDAVQDVDLKALLAYRHNIPFVIPLTAAYSNQSMPAAIKRAEGAALRYFRSTKTKNVDGTITIAPRRQWDTVAGRTQFRQAGVLDKIVASTMFSWYSNVNTDRTGNNFPALFTLQQRTYGHSFRDVRSPVMAASTFTEVEDCAVLCFAAINDMYQDSTGDTKVSNSLKYYEHAEDRLKELEIISKKRIVKKEAGKMASAASQNIQRKTQPKQKKEKGAKLTAVDKKRMALPGRKPKDMPLAEWRKQQKLLRTNEAAIGLNLLANAFPGSGTNRQNLLAQFTQNEQDQRQKIEAEAGQRMMGIGSTWNEMQEQDQRQKIEADDSLQRKVRIETDWNAVQKIMDQQKQLQQLLQQQQVPLAIQQRQVPLAIQRPSASAPTSIIATYSAAPATRNIMPPRPLADDDDDDEAIPTTTTRFVRSRFVPNDPMWANQIPNVSRQPDADSNLAQKPNMDDMIQIMTDRTVEANDPDGGAWFGNKWVPGTWETAPGRSAGHYRGNAQYQARSGGSYGTNATCGGATGLKRLTRVTKEHEAFNSMDDPNTFYDRTAGRRSGGRTNLKHFMKPPFDENRSPKS